MWTEIIALRHGGLLVDGDIVPGPVVFRYGPPQPEARVHWMGGCKYAHDSYFREKASIGMGGRGSVTETWDADVARDDLLEMEAEFKGDPEEWSEPSPKMAEEVARVRECLLAALGLGHRPGRGWVLWKLYEAGVDPELFERIGMVTATRLYYAHAALARLSALLTEKEDSTGKGCEA
jgi:hypothetical protein